MKIGQMVILIATDGFMPPIGSYGEVIEPLDSDGDYGVLFPLHPCPNPPGIHWYAPPSMLMPINGEPLREHEEEPLGAVK